MKATRKLLLAAFFISLAWLAQAQVAAGVMFLRRRMHRMMQEDPSSTDKITAELTSELDLTAQQQAQLQNIILATRKSIEASLMDGENRINGILSDEQKVKFEQYRARIKDEIKAGSLE